MVYVSCTPRSSICVRRKVGSIIKRAWVASDGRTEGRKEVGMKTDFVEQELRNVGALEMAYRKVAEMVAPAELEENPTASARVYLAALRGLERCVELRLKLIREAGRLPGEEPEEPMATIDLSRLSDDALREVETALIPLETERESENRGGKEVNDA